jgi:hypothetical protein
MTTKTEEAKKNFYWLSFARPVPKETFVVIEEAETVQEAVVQAMPLNRFNPREWSIQPYQIPGDGEELKDFKLHTLIHKADLIAKGYQKV